MTIDHTKHAFVVGTGRCGSTLLSELMRDFSSGTSLSEFFTMLGGPAALAGVEVDGPAFWQSLDRIRSDVWELLCAAPDMPEVLWRAEERSRMSPLKAVPLPHLTHRVDDVHAALKEFVSRLPRRAVAEQYSAVFEWLQRRMHKRYWIERSGGSLEYVDRLLACWPEAKFIHVFRDGPSCAVSMARHPFFRARVARMLARDAALPAIQALDRVVALDRFAAYWSAVIVSGVRALSRVPRSQVLHVAYEELTARPFDTIAGVLRFLEDDAVVRLDASALGRRVRSAPNRLDVLSRGERAALERACRPGSRALEAVLARGA